MNSSPGQPDKYADSAKPQNGIKEAEERRRQQLLAMAMTYLPAKPSWGERLLPTFLAAMEACWVDVILIGLAGIGLFQSPGPIVPLWAPFVIIAGSYWLTTYLERRAARMAPVPDQEEDPTRTVTPGTSLLIALMAVVTLFIIWLRIYAQTWLVFDPRWLLNMLNDILLLNANAYLMFTILGVCIYLCWRGVRIVRREIEPANVLNVLRLGLVIIVAVVVIRAGQESAGVVFHDWLALFLLVPIFLILSLAAHALARAGYVRHTHPIGLEGNVATQERSLLLLIGAFGLVILLVTLSLGSVAVPSFFQEIQSLLNEFQGPLGAAYDWLVNLIAHIIVFLVTPLFLLLAAFEARYPPRLPQIRNPNSGIGRFGPHKPSTALDSFYLILIPILKVALAILFVVMMLLLIRWALRRRRVRIIAQRREDEVRESLWSWSLFWTQLIAFLYALFAFFFPRPKQEMKDQAEAGVIEGGPSARSIREIYRLLLKRAAGRGYERKKDETPFEFRQRLDEKTPLAEPRLETITEAYALTRYGEVEPDASEVARIQGTWAEVEQKWIQR